MDWAQILVIILSVFLALFLLLGIALIVLLIKVTRQIKAVTDSARHTAQNIESAVADARRMASPLLLVGMIMKQLKKVRGRK